MDIRIIETGLDGVVVVETDFFRDERGFFIESYHKQRYFDYGLKYEFVQDNHSRSVRHVLRGLHYQDMSAPMGKLVRCTAGSILDVAVDLRLGSPNCGKWVSVELSCENMRQLFVPPGYAHGFLTLSDSAEVQYKCTAYYTPASEGVIAWNDADLAIDWPCSEPMLSARDTRGMALRDYLKNPAFRYPVL